MSITKIRLFVYNTLFFLAGPLVLAPVPVAAATWQTSATSVSTTVGNTATFTTTVASSSSVNNVIVDVEVYDAAGNRALQQIFANQTLGTTAKNLTVSWIPKAAGTYTIKIGVFSSYWSLYNWNNNAGTITVTNPVAAPTSPSGQTIEIWWPVNNVNVTGVQPFKSLVSGKSLTSYKMYWQVDGGQLNLMPDNYTDAPHKEVLVDVGGWNWKGNGPYVLNFVAKDNSGLTIASKQSTIYVNGGAPAATVTTPTVTAPTTVAPTIGGTAMTVNTSQNRRAISPFIYGSNFQGDPNSWDGTSRNFTLARFGGNRLTTYNWENNASNAGNDWQQQNDGYLGGGNTPGEAVRNRVAIAHNSNAAALVTVPMQGYVAADKNGDGDVNKTPNYLIARFKQTVAKKNGALSTNPDLNDSAVYQDEFVSFLEQKFPNSKTDPNKKIFYSLDNEPDLWKETHPRIQSQPVTYAGLMEKTITFADAIKDVVPHSTVFGSVNYGFNGFQTLQDAPDANGRNYLDFFLSSLKQAEAATGHRLVDVLDVHWYPEAQGGGRRIIVDDADQSIAEARMQAPRSLWDPSYTESSWIASATGGPIKLLPMLKQKINTHYPGTKLAISEYYYGGGADISGAIAQADVLGIFGREDVFAANLWHIGGTDDRFIYGAFDMFRNVDGKGTSFGNTSVNAVTSDNAGTSVYASVDSQNPNRVTVVVINKTDKELPVNVTLMHSTALTRADVYQLTSASAKPVAKGSVTVANNVLSQTLPARSVTTFIVTP